MNISFRLKPGRDDLIIKWMENHGTGDRAHFIREALKLYINCGGSNNILLPPPSPFRSRNVDMERLQPEEPESQEIEKNNNVDLNAVMDEWCDSE